jgi:hypothetical protein
MSRKKSIFFGVIAAFMLLAIYFTVISILNSFEEALIQFSDIWYWIILLSAGFGTQIGLFLHIKFFRRVKTKGLTAEVTATGGVSTVSMIACCAHYMVGVLPLLGLSAAVMFLVEYQVSFLLVGIFSNLLGIIVMLMKIKKQKIYTEGAPFRKVANINLKAVFYSVLIVSVFGLTTSFTITSRNSNWSSAERPQATNGAVMVADEQKEKATKNNGSYSAVQTQEYKFKTLLDSQNGVDIEAVVEDFSFNKPFKISIKFNTHSGNLGFEVEKIALLVDSEGNVYLPLGWEGDPPGGHHRSGKLLFPALNMNVSYIKLEMKGIYGVDTRSFKWEMLG